MQKVEEGVLCGGKEEEENCDRGLGRGFEKKKKKKGNRLTGPAERKKEKRIRGGREMEEKKGEK